jgi:hypothetical protein
MNSYAAEASRSSFSAGTTHSVKPHSKHMRSLGNARTTGLSMFFNPE